MMKKINLAVYNFAGSLRIMMHFLLKVDKPHIFAPIKAILDTGSPTTLISPADMEKMRISKLQIKKMEGRKKQSKIGGGQIYTKIIENAKISLENFEIEMPVEFPVENEDSSIPSLIGIDFLIKTKAKLFFDPTNKKAHLEINEE